MTATETLTPSKPIDQVINESIQESKSSITDPYTFDKPIKNVAVIGAGPSGLCAARRLRDAGLNVRVFERNQTVGGVWVYTEKTPLKPKIPTSRVKREIDEAALNAPTEGKTKKILELTPETMNKFNTKCPPSAVYRDLITNVSKRRFSFEDFSFTGDIKECAFHHTVAQAYFKAYAEKFDLFPLIEFETSVDLMMKNKQEDTWDISLSKWQINPGGMLKVTRWKESFDAVVCATGSYSDPVVPDIDQLTAYNKTYPQRVSHVKQFRRPEDFVDKNVLVVGGNVSATDVCRSLEGFAKSVTVSMNKSFESPIELLNTLKAQIPKSTIKKLNIKSFSNAEDEVDGAITFADGTTVHDFNHVIFCTGYGVRLDFIADVKEQLEKPKTPPSYLDIPKSQVVLGRTAPSNLYRETFLMNDPTMTFVGLIPYPIPTQFDLQAMSITRVWTGKTVLPSVELMDKYIAEYDLGLDIPNYYNAEIRYRATLVAWLNHQRQALDHTDDTELEYCPEDYESSAAEDVTRWIELSEQRMQENKKYIKEHYL